MVQRACFGCGTPVPSTAIACGEDWARLPSRVRQAINRGQMLQRQARANPDNPRAMEQATRIHAAAVREATAWFKANPRGNRS